MAKGGGNPVKPKKWGAYDTEHKEFEFARTDQPFAENVKCVEAELMDWADDITFSVHDLIDFYCAGRIPLEQLSLAGVEFDTEERNVFFREVFARCEDLKHPDAQDIFKKTFQEILVEMFPLSRRYVGSRNQRCNLWQYSTILISRYLNSIVLQPPDENGRCVIIKKSAEDEIRVLKELTWHYVILQNDLATDQHGQRKMVRSVFTELRSAALVEKEWTIFPPFFKEELRGADGDESKLTRTVADYVSSMTETELVRTYRALIPR